jgi:hypothetical protein
LEVEKWQQAGAKETVSVDGKFMLFNQGGPILHEAK